jgi:hypothetical protein
MNKPFSLKRTHWLALLFLVSILFSMLIIYPFWLKKVRANFEGYVIVHNQSNTSGKLKLQINDSIYERYIKSKSSISFNVRHKIRDNNLSIHFTGSSITLSDTFSLPWDEKCCICLGIDNPKDSIGAEWNVLSSKIIPDKYHYGGLYLRKTTIQVKNNLRLKCSVQQSKNKNIEM